ncbi:MBG domain-containing protein [uncultured Fibrobacter sp.]|uniref:MBG domain-containing protein n=1 Tax=uncultured Fibrobacter sp. TaxID=261512 RepID=UPI00261B89E5|nr:MBG domain-containing protein [uncultured Fibrobacter sp.]
MFSNQKLSLHSLRLGFVLIFTLLMAATSWAADLEAVSYIDENGAEKFLEPGSYTLLDTLLGGEYGKPDENDVIHIPGGWYVVQNSNPNGENLNIAFRTLSFDGETHIVIEDGAEMHLESTDIKLIQGDLSIYGQTLGTGTLTVYDSSNTICPVVVNGNLSINGGNITIRKGDGLKAIEASGEVHINSGTVNISSNIDKDDPEAEATIQADDGVILDWHNANDRYTLGRGNSISFAKDKGFKDEDGNVYSKFDESLIDKTILPCYVVTLNLQDGRTPNTVATTFDENDVAHVAKPEDPSRFEMKFLGWFTTENGDTEFDFFAPVTANTTVYAKWAKKLPEIEIDKIPDQIYIGDSICPTPDIEKPDSILVNDDYKVYCENNLNVGKASFVIEGIGRYYDKTIKEFNITKAPLTVVAKNKTISYGDEPANDSVECIGFVGVDTLKEISEILNGTISYEYSYKAGDKAASGYTITPGNVTANNYEIQFKEGELTVVPKEVSIAWDKQNTFTYDGTEHIPAVTFEGVLEDDKCSFTVTGAATNAGKYTATVTELSNPNYKLPETGFEQAFEITKAPLTVTALNDTIVYGDDLSFAGVVYSGFVGEEDESVLNGTLAYECKYDRGGAAGKYDITPSGLTAENYDIEFVAGELTVGPKNVTITWGNTLFFYDGKEHVPTATVEGVLEGDKCVATVTGAAEEVGNHIATVTEICNSNYKLNKTASTSFSIRELTDIAYIDANGSEQTLTKYNVLTGNETALDAGWYVVLNDITYTNSLQISGDVHIVLTDDYTMSIGTTENSINSYGITKDYNGKASLTIYGQSTGTGKLDIYAWDKAIYADNVTLNGGFINAESSDLAIYSEGEVTINDGTVITKSSGSAIFANEKININGGIITVEAQSTCSSSMESWNPVTGAPGEINFSWKNETDSIMFKSPFYGMISFANGKFFKDEDNNIYAGHQYVYFGNERTFTPYYAPFVVYTDYLDDKTYVAIDGNFNGTDAIKIETDIAVDKIILNRTFKQSGFATIMLPFDYDASNLQGVKSIVEFNGVQQSNGKSSVGMQYVWCNKDVQDSLQKDAIAKCNANGDTDCEKTAKYERCNESDYFDNAGKIFAYTPYMVQVDADVITFTIGATLKPTPAKTETRGEVDGDWIFRGTLQKHTWTEDETKDGLIRAFAAKVQDGAKQIGQFVKLGAGAYSPALRAYMIKEPKVQMNAPLPRGVEYAPAIMPSAENNLPETMDVVIVSRSTTGGNEQTTVIGSLNPRTGEFHLNNVGKRTFDLKGRSVSKPRAKGIYLKK